LLKIAFFNALSVHYVILDLDFFTYLSKERTWFMFKKIWNSHFIRSTIIGIIVGAFFFGLFLIWSSNTSLVGFIDALTMASLIVFATGWFLYFSNEGALSSLFYGMKTFFKGIAGKRPAKSYFEEMNEREKIPKNIYRGFWFASLLYAIALVILYVVYVTN